MAAVGIDKDTANVRDEGTAVKPMPKASPVTMATLSVDPCVSFLPSPTHLGV